MPTRFQPGRLAHTAAASLADALSMLACPVCHAALVMHEMDGANKVLCIGCRRTYPLRDGIPVLIAGEAVEAPKGNAT